MLVSIISNSSNIINGKKYNYIEVKVDTKSVRVHVSPYCGVNVIVMNAMHKAYKGFGKNFKTIDEAIGNYKDKKIIKAIETAKELLEA